MHYPLAWNWMVANFSYGITVLGTLPLNNWLLTKVDLS